MKGLFYPIVVSTLNTASTVGTLTWCTISDPNAQRPECRGIINGIQQAGTNYINEYKNSSYQKKGEMMGYATVNVVVSATTIIALKGELTPIKNATLLNETNKLTKTTKITGVVRMPKFLKGVKKFKGSFKKPFKYGNHRENLKVLTGLDVPGFLAHAHHVFPNAKNLRFKFEKAGFKGDDVIDNPKYLVWWKVTKKGDADYTAGHLKCKDQYNKDWEEFFEPYIKKGISPSKEKILEFGKEIMKKYDNGNNVSPLNY